MTVPEFIVVAFPRGGGVTEGKKKIKQKGEKSLPKLREGKGEHILQGQWGGGMAGEEGPSKER